MRMHTLHIYIYYHLSRENYDLSPYFFSYPPFPFLNNFIAFNCWDKSMTARSFFDILREYASKRDIVRGMQHAFQSVQHDEYIFFFFFFPSESGYAHVEI